MTTLRSEEMVRGTLVLPSALPVARECLDLLGRQGSVHFIDMNEHCLTRQFSRYVQRIDEMERIIRFLEGEVQRLQEAGARIVHSPEGPQNFLESDKGYQLDKVEEALNRLYAQFIRFKNNNADLLEQKNLALEEKCVMQTAVQHLRGDTGETARGGEGASGAGEALEGARGGGGAGEGDEGPPSTRARGSSRSEEEVARSLLRADEEDEQLIRGEEEEDLEEGQLVQHGARRDRGAGKGTSVGVAGAPAVSTVAGMVATAHIPRFQRLLFRSTRGNAFCFFQPTAEKFVEGKTGKEVEKGVFVIYYQGTARSLLHEKIVKACAAFDARPYEWPHTLQEANARLRTLQSLLNDKERALAAYERYFLGEISLLLEVTRPGGSSLLEEWKMFCQKEKALYATLNMFQGKDMTLRCDCWIPKEREEDVRTALREVGADSGGEEQASAFLLVEKGKPAMMPPTYFKSTEFTEAAQIMVDTYGVPRYREANPAVLTTITFPFLFGVMYGDVGHGVCVLLLAFYLMWEAKPLQQNRDAAFHGAVKYRYMILLMGFFAFFGGFMYNDWFALGFDICKTRWTWKGATRSGTNYVLNKREGDFPYPFGFDPAWKGATNELLFTNSFKMKFSVIVGFVQMLAGVVLKGSNAYFYRQPLDFFFEFVPQIIFICSLVGYMDFLIYYKWMTPTTRNKPNLINTIIHMCMLTEIEAKDRLFESEQMVERVLFFLMVISVPVMLLPKPIILCVRNNRRRKGRRAGTGVELGGGGGGAGGGRGEDVEEGDAKGSKNRQLNQQQQLSYRTAAGTGISSGGVEGRTLQSKRTNSSTIELEQARGAGEAAGGAAEDRAAAGGKDDTVGDAAAETKGEQQGETAAGWNEEKQLEVAAGGGGGMREDDGRAGEERWPDQEEEESSGDLFIHQMIETIEFILGTISNTASYLRLWALSLAHQQLALVFYVQIVVRAIEFSENVAIVAVMLFFVFAIYACITFAVILCMDFLEVSLHALRLQWVEFQNKFYHGDGYKFAPLSFLRLLSGEEDDM